MLLRIFGTANLNMCHTNLYCDVGFARSRKCDWLEYI